MSQYALPITLTPVFSESNFSVSGSSREAYEWVMRWPEWPGNAFFIHGPAGAGKTHLGHIWAARAKATIVDADALSPQAAHGPILIDNINRVKDERALLHALNIGKEAGHPTLLLSSQPPSRLPFALPDLTSRLKALPAAAILPPDDEALAAALRKQFADRQLKIDDAVVDFLLPRMERSFAGLSEMVQKIDTLSLEARKNLTIPFLKRALNY